MIRGFDNVKELLKTVNFLNNQQFCFITQKSFSPSKSYKPLFINKFTFSIWQKIIISETIQFCSHVDFRLILVQLSFVAQNIIYCQQKIKVNYITIVKQVLDV